MHATPEPSPPRAWAEIDLSSLKNNLAAIQRYRPDQAVMAVIKAGAYGHGLEQVARCISHSGLAFLGVANVSEARRVVAAGVTEPRVYLLGATLANERAEIVAADWTPCLSSMAEARDFDARARASGRRLRAHVAVDTGMGRGGFLPSELTTVLPLLRQLPGLEIEGIGSHLPAADEDRAFSEQQFSDFNALITALGGDNTFRWRHLANSAGLLGYPAHGCNLARPGLLLYGISPLVNPAIDVTPVMTLKSRVSLIRTLPAGHGVSYGRAYVTTRPTRVATVGIGYGDGYPRHVSGHQAQVAINAQRFPVLGRVTMDQLMIDVTEAPEIAEGAEVELFGREISVREVAQWADTIAWHIFTGITPRVTRIYRD